MNAVAAPRRFKAGAAIGPRHTVLGVIDRKAGRNPIYLVWDHAAWCPVVCKVFRSRQRAEREASLLAEFAHPNVVRSFGLGDDATLFLELLEGPTLARLLDDSETGRVGVSDALRIVIHVGAALHFIHGKGAIYLDLSASNVIVTPTGRPVLIDFGAARRRDETRPPKVIGTDPYIAPEECLQQAVTPAADIFGLGVLLFELLSGELPFPRGTPKAPFPQTDSDPTPLRRLRPALPKGLERLVMSCLAADPLARPDIPSLLPALHGHIRAGPRMWPPGFRPGPTAARPGRSAGRAAKP